MADQHDLSVRELEILKLVATGASNKEIAKKLYISPNTVKVHLKNIFGKIGVISRTEAAMFAVRYGLVESDSISVELDNNLESELDRDISITENTSSRRIYWLLGLSFILFLIGVGLVLASRSGFVTQANITPPTPTEIPRWQKKADMPTARFGLAAAVFDNKIYAIGGETDHGVTGVVERYDPVTDTWEKLADKPTPVADVGAVVIGGKIYVPGGRLVDGKTTDILEVFDPVTNLWKKGEKLPIKVGAYAIAAFEGKMYVFGGWDGVKYLDLVIEFDPGNNIWLERSKMLTGRAYAGSGIVGGNIYIIGGYDGLQPLDINEEYISESEGMGLTWKNKASAPVPLSSFSMVTILDTLYAFTENADNGRNVDKIYNYLPQFDEWRGIGDFPISFGEKFGTGLIGASIYIFGGLKDDKPSDQNLEYQVLYMLTIPLVR